LAIRFTLQLPSRVLVESTGPCTASRRIPKRSFDTGRRPASKTVGFEQANAAGIAVVSPTGRAWAVEAISNASASPKPTVLDAADHIGCNPLRTAVEGHHADAESHTAQPRSRTNMRKPDLSRREFTKAMLGAAAGLAVPTAVLAQAYPSKPIKLIVGFVPGGLTDGIPRLLAPRMAERLGQPVVVENKVGAAGNIATSFVAQSPPDGYTLLASTVGQIVVSPHTSKMALNPMTDLVNIVMMGEGDQILTINAEVPARDIKEFIALARARPGTMFYGDAGLGGSMHLYLEYFTQLANVDLQAVHYKGGGQLMPDFLANRFQLSLNSYPTVEGHIKAGKLRPILIVGKQRDPRMPAVPTAAEAGLKSLEAASNWFGLHAPKGTPRPIIDKIHDAVVDALKTDSVRTGLEAMAIRPVGDTTESFNARIAADYAVFERVAKAAKIQAVE
jgi:tripartite-type tricarboxylate transporter receptor subunit TctC